MTDARTPTAVDGIAERHLDALIAHDPLLASQLGVPGHERELPALDPDWYAGLSAIRRSTRADLDAAAPTDANDRITVAALGNEIEADEHVRALGDDECSLNNLDSPVQTIRDIFDLMSVATADDWATVAARLGEVPAALAGYAGSLRHAASRGVVPARRQVDIGIAQARANTGADGFFARWTSAATTTTNGAPLPDSVRADLERNARAAGEAYERLAAFFADELYDRARAEDPVGRERYEPHSRRWVGCAIDLDENYAWAQDELARIVAEMRATAARIVPGASVPDAVAALERDPQRRVDGTDAFRDWMQRKSDAAVEALSGPHFDIPEAIRTLECRIAPTRNGGVYYTGPSDDLITRPGRMWWSVPRGVTWFATWKELTTVYHEGVPGHHLQVAQTVLRRDLLNRWRRRGVWTSGYGEGWALYAESLMADLGFLDDPADRLGMLDAQLFRAARVVLDIGIHCGLAAPSSVGGGDWDYDKAWAFLAEHCHSAEATRRFELDRYLGWPGQAPSYKVGQRLWLQLRDDVRAHEGDDFNLVAFHRRALDTGAVGMDVLRAAMLGEYDR